MRQARELFCQAANAGQIVGLVIGGEDGELVQRIQQFGRREAGTVAGLAAMDDPVARCDEFGAINGGTQAARQFRDESFRCRVDL